MYLIIVRINHERVQLQGERKKEEEEEEKKPKRKKRRTHCIAKRNASIMAISSLPHAIKYIRIKHTPCVRALSLYEISLRNPEES